MSPEKRIKAQSRRILSMNNWGKAVGIFFLSFVAVLIPICVADMIIRAFALLFEQYSHSDSLLLSLGSLLSLGLLIILSPLLLGALRYFYLLSKEKDTRFNEVFFYFGQGYTKAVQMCLRMFVSIGLKFYLCLLPAIVALGNTQNIGNGADPEDAVAFALLKVLAALGGLILLFGGLLLGTVWSMRSFLAPFFFFEDEQSGIIASFNRSAAVMPHYRSSVTKLTISFTPWFLLCFFVFPVLYVIPYFVLSLSTSAKWIISLYKEVNQVC